MNKKILALTLGVCIFATGCSAVSQRDYDALAKENSRLQEANEKLESEISALKDSESEAESSVAASVPASAASAAEESVPAAEATTAATTATTTAAPVKNVRTGTSRLRTKQPITSAS